VDPPLISVIIPAFNAASTIDRALNAVWRQDYAPIEVIVIDDGSTDETAAAVERHSGRGVRLLRLPRNVGECGAMNAGIAVASGDYLAFLDADDEWLDGKLRKQMAVLTAHPAMTFVTSGFHYVDDQGRPVQKSDTGHLPPELKEFWRDLLAASYVAKPCVIARAAALAAVGGFDENLVVAGDQDMWIRLSLAGDVGFVNEDLVRVHITADSLTRRYAAREMEYTLPMVMKYLRSEKERLSPREIREALRRRFTAIGRNAYLHGRIAAGALLILRAVMLGYRPVENLLYLVSASPPARALKRRMQRGPGRGAIVHRPAASSVPGDDEPALEPLITVVIPAFNAAHTIGRALASVRRQSYRNVEIVVVDDCSADDTVARVRAAADENVRLVQLPRNVGAAAARNAGIAEAGGELVAFLDADDEWRPQKLERQVALIARRPKMSFVSCQCGFIGVDGEVHAIFRQEFAPATGFEAWRVLLAYTFVATPTVLTRRALLVKLGGFDPALIIGEDQDMWIRLALEGEVGFIREPLVVIHQQLAGLSSRTAEREIDIVLPMIRRHYEAQRRRLTRREKRRILGHRYTQLGRNLYHFSPSRGLLLLLKAVLLGHRPVENLAYIVNASPPGRRLKRAVLGQ
jgi:glycosyltransferase involved in cell wall biosynthesis